jgi:hypothetical protein
MGVDNLARGLAVRALAGSFANDVVYGARIDNSADDTAALAALFASGAKQVVIKAGVRKITSQLVANGIRIVCEPGAEFNFVSDTDTPWTVSGPRKNGAIVLTGGAELVGGTFYTSGAAPGATGYVIGIDDGEAVGCTVYSQLLGGITWDKGKGPRRCTVYGGKQYGIIHGISVDAEYQLVENRIFQTGVRYVAKVWNSVNTTNVFAIRVSPAVNLTQPYLIARNLIEHSTKQGIWVQNGAFTVAALTIDDNRIRRIGYYLDASGVETAGASSGTGIEIINCPDAKITDNKVSYPAGYNVAVASGSHRTVVQGNVLIGLSGDPVVVVSSSDDVHVVRNHIKDGTVGVSMGEDGATANRTHVTENDIVNCNNGAFLCDTGTGFYLSHNRIHGGGTATSYAGSITGPGELVDACRVRAGADDIRSIGNTFSGQFVEIYRPTTVRTIKMHIDGDRYECPYVPPINLADEFRKTLIRNPFVTPPVLPILAADTGSRSNTGSLMIDSSTVSLLGTALAVTNIEAYVGPYASASADAADYHLLFYVKKSANMNGNLRVGLSSGATAADYLLVVDLSAILTNATAKIASLQNGEWFAVHDRLRSCVYSTDFTALAYLNVIKEGYSPNYALEITKPVIIKIREA